MKNKGRSDCHTVKLEEETEIQANEIARLSAQLIEAHNRNLVLQDDKTALEQQNAAYMKDIGTLAMKCEELQGEINVLKQEAEQSRQAQESTAKMERWASENVAKLREEAREAAKEASLERQKAEDLRNRLLDKQSQLDRCLGWIASERQQHPLSDDMSPGNYKGMDGG